MVSAYRYASLLRTSTEVVDVHFRLIGMHVRCITEAIIVRKFPTFDATVFSEA